MVQKSGVYQLRFVAYPSIYTPVNQHSHGKSTILMVFTRKDGIFMGKLLVSGRVQGLIDLRWLAVGFQPSTVVNLIKMFFLIFFLPPVVSFWL